MKVADLKYLILEAYEELLFESADELSIGTVKNIDIFVNDQSSVSDTMFYRLVDNKSGKEFEVSVDVAGEQVDLNYVKEENPILAKIGFPHGDAIGNYIVKDINKELDDDDDDFVDEEYKPGSIAPEDLYYSDKHGRLVAIDDVDYKYHDSLELVYKKGDKIEGPMDEKKGNHHDEEIISFIADTYIQNAKDGDRAYDGFRDLHISDAVQDVIGILQDPNHPLHAATKEEYAIVEKDKARGIFEKKGTDHDKDGDIDGDDYKHAKDKAIKKAMGKDVNEEESVNINEVKTAIKTVISNILKEAHTPTLQSFIDREDTNTELEAAAKDLMNVIEQMESEFLKHKDKIAAAYEKAGAYMAPALEKAFAQDLNSQRVSFEKIELPASPRLTPDQVDQINQANEAGDIEEKNTVYTPTK